MDTTLRGQRAVSVFHLLEYLHLLTSYWLTGSRVLCSSEEWMDKCKNTDKWNANKLFTYIQFVSLRSYDKRDKNTDLLSKYYFQNL
jgi:hypothetical protein